MRRWIPALLVPLTLAFTNTSHALAPGDRERGFREGANHHLGDDGFTTLYKRAPGTADTEPLRMHAHFTHVRRWLATRPATKPELASRRAELLGYFDEYIAAKATPENAHVPWRTPVFIDDRGTICAVGYLIERSVGRALAEQIAKEHRYNVLEDIAAAMPEVRAWVESSGFTLDELASVQPGYVPIVTWNDNDLVAGPSGEKSLEVAATSRSGTWHGKYPNGERLAEGPFVDKKAHGAWRFFHPSGNLAAQGSFTQGYRDGRWTFFYDSTELVPMATGSFRVGSLIEEWRQFDRKGNLAFRAQPASPASFRGAGYLLDVIGRQDGVKHWVHQGNVAGLRHRLDFLADGSEHLYVYVDQNVAYDGTGHKLVRDYNGWQSSDCHFRRVLRASARSGDLVTLHGLLAEGQSSCDDPRPVDAVRSKHLDAMLAPLRTTSERSAGGETHDPAAEFAQNMASYLARPDVGAAASPPQRDAYANR